MYKILFGMMAGVTLALVATQVFQTKAPGSLQTSTQVRPGINNEFQHTLTQITTELAVLQASVDGLNARIDSNPPTVRYETEEAAEYNAVAVPAQWIDTPGGEVADPDQVAARKQEVLDRLAVPGVTLPEFMASAELSELPPEAQNEVMQELVRRFNSGEIDRVQFIPGYK